MKLTRQPNHLGHWEPIELGGPGTFLDKALTIPNPDPAEVCLWHTRTGSALACPYGRPDDKLWVREMWAVHPRFDIIKTSELEPRARDGSLVWYDGETCPDSRHGRSRPSIHMPRWASRLTLLLTDVRVQRLQEISEEDAVAETGVVRLPATGRWVFNKGDQYLGLAYSTPRCAFSELWDSINAERAPWNDNPWVWALTFEVVSK